MKSQSAYVGSHWIELQRSNIAQLLKFAFYILILWSLAIWPLAAVWKVAVGLAVLTYCIVDYCKDLLWLKDNDVNTVILSIEHGIIATGSGHQLRNVKSFKIEYILCYYIQIYLCYEDGGHLRLHIFPDSADEKALHKFRCVGVRYETIK